MNITRTADLIELHAPNKGTTTGVTPVATGIRLGKSESEAAAKALLDHLPGIGGRVTGDFAAALRGDAEFLLWSGEHPEDRTGRYWIAALFRSTDLADVVRSVAADKGIDETTARERVRRYHAGLGDSLVVHSIAAFAEIDHLSREEQERRLDALAAASGLRWTLKVFSGGKSIHGYISYDRTLDPADPLRLEIQKLLIAILEADTKITNAGRLMRLPGWDGAERKQPIIHLDDTAHFRPEDVRDRLLAYAASMGITDIDRAIEVLRLAERLESEARKQIGEAKQELQAHAAKLRATRADPDREDLDLASVMLGSRTQTAGSAVAVPAGIGKGAKGAVQRLPAATMAPFKGLPKFSRVAAPCCGDPGPGSNGPAGTIMSESMEEPRVWCHRCQHTVLGDPHLALPQPPMDPATTEEALREVLAAIDDLSPNSEAEAETELNDDREAQQLADWVSLREYMEHFMPRVEARKAKAEQVDPIVAACARKALDAAKGWHTDIRREWRAAGLDSRGGKCGAINQGLGNVTTGRSMVIGRRCDRLSCIFCGPMAVARKAAAILHMPILNRAGEVAGAPMGMRPLFLHRVGRAELASWLLRWRRAARAVDDRLPPKGIKRGVRRKSVTGSRSPFGKHAYARLDSADPDDQVTILSSFDMGGSAVDPATLGATVLDIVRKTYSVEQDEFGVLHEVVGKVRSSQGLALDPDRIVKLAQPNAWVVERAGDIVSPAEAAKRLKTIGIEANSERDHDGVIGAIKVDAQLSRSERGKMWAALDPDYDPNIVKTAVAPAVIDIDPDTLDPVMDMPAENVTTASDPDDLMYWWPDEVVFNMAFKIGLPLVNEHGQPAWCAADLPALFLRVVVEDLLKEPDLYPPERIRRGDLPRGSTMAALPLLGGLTRRPIRVELP